MGDTHGKTAGVCAIPPSEHVTFLSVPCGVQVCSLSSFLLSSAPVSVLPMCFSSAVPTSLSISQFLSK